MFNATFVSWVQEKDKQYLQIKTKDRNVLVPFDGGEINEESYKKFIKDILDEREAVPRPIQ